ncbi:hypothetical protein LOZ80_24435 [Paenibacillus sp. HWE-109]|uniref:hypothetical protein n=1 Tax=Paenibacillus sp. HWE-109 TaxID=1306526 RepID=UPI001EDDEBDC|nr:hypothetical protein [Paenibacillus sp. HWE-109]UKS24742.1 hypothetical protein LOZ80_24435 [Paenibacillus sp. HWE-109]
MPNQRTGAVNAEIQRYSCGISQFQPRKVEKQPYRMRKACLISEAVQLMLKYRVKAAASARSNPVRLKNNLTACEKHAKSVKRRS